MTYTLTINNLTLIGGHIAHPANSIIGAILLIALFVTGLCFFRWWKARRHSTKQTDIEDTLKHIFHSEYQGNTATLGSLAGALQIPTDKAAVLIRNCQTEGLLDLNGDKPVLTPKGRDLAIHIIRVHRLWESYLAEFTGFDRLDWHKEAEAYEHLLTPEETSALETLLNNPTHDPHGDPIPTAQGEMPPPETTVLSDLSPGSRALVLHVEDEPQSVYAQLVASNIQPGVELEVVKTTGHDIVFHSRGENKTVSSLAAANVTVRRSRSEPSQQFNFKTLAQLPLGHNAKIIQLASSCRGLERERMLDLGFIPGSRVSVVMSSPFGDTRAYQVRGTTVALRKEQAERILITDIEHTSHPILQEKGSAG